MKVFLPSELKRRRQAAGLTLGELSRRTLLTEGFLSRLENGKARALPHTLRAVDDAIDDARRAAVRSAVGVEDE